jgi:hypothetical protein
MSPSHPPPVKLDRTLVAVLAAGGIALLFVWAGGLLWVVYSFASGALKFIASTMFRVLCRRFMVVGLAAMKQVVTSPIWDASPRSSRRQDFCLARRFENHVTPTLGQRFPIELRHAHCMASTCLSVP